MRVLIACEYSAVVRDAFRARGHDAYSCDLLRSEGSNAWHWNCDLFHEDGPFRESWDLMIAHPPCTRLSNSGVKHLYKGMKKENGIDPDKWQEMEKAAEFFRKLCEAPIEKKAIENPVMHKHAIELTGGRATQYVQPSMFGTRRRKLTGLRLFNLPRLIPTNDLEDEYRALEKGSAEYKDWNYCWYMPPGPDRGHKRARTETAIADAMAEQWEGCDE